MMLALLCGLLGLLLAYTPRTIATHRDLPAATLVEPAEFYNPLGALTIQVGQAAFPSSNWWVVFSLNTSSIPTQLDQLKNLTQLQISNSSSLQTGIDQVKQLIDHIEKEYEVFLEETAKPSSPDTDRSKRSDFNILEDLPAASL